jgi:hypothetical protein
MKVVTTTNRFADGGDDWACGDPELVEGVLAAQLPKLTAIAETTTIDNRRAIPPFCRNPIFKSFILNILVIVKLNGNARDKTFLTPHSRNYCNINATSLARSGTACLMARTARGIKPSGLWLKGRNLSQWHKLS